MSVPRSCDFCSIAIQLSKLISSKHQDAILNWAHKKLLTVVPAWEEGGIGGGLMELGDDRLS